MIADFDDVFDFAEEKFAEAKKGSLSIVFPKEAGVLSEGTRAYGSEGLSIHASAITDIPEYKILKHATGQCVQAAVLAVDLRQSSSRALVVGAENTYLTMHTYLPTMAYLVGEAGGHVVGLRGDGLFAAFGLDEDGDETDLGKAVKTAIRCGKAMIEAVDEVINEVLRDNDVEDGLAIGVGVDVGDIVITRIGLNSASEVTAYGHAVNHACKKYAARGRNEIRISKAANDVHPTSKGGRLTFTQCDGFTLVEFPRDMKMLGGDGR